jgi:hypothetical protein
MSSLKPEVVTHGRRLEYLNGPSQIKVSHCMHFFLTPVYSEELSGRSPDI